VTDHVDQQGGTLTTFDPTSVEMTFSYSHLPPPTTLTSPAARSVIATTTPTLTAAPVTDDTPTAYDFRLTTWSDGTGLIVDSGWLDGETSWQVPPGSLHDGVTYYATVLTSPQGLWYAADPGQVPHAAAPPPIPFQVKERLGDAGPSPADLVGTLPAGATAPSQGAPSPGVPPASETVNLVTGNLAIGLGTPSMKTVSGPAGVTLAYNSASASVSRGGNYGLTGQY
jgi:hypothetical protein